jgi:hypothetical protein
MGLLGQGFDDPQSSAIMALAGGLLQGNFGAGLLGANSAYQGAQEGLLKRQLLQQQAQQGQMGLDEMRRKLADDDATRKVLQGIYGAQGLPQSPTQGQMPQAGAQPGGMGAPQGMAPAMGQPSGGVTPKADVWQQYKMIGDKLASQGLVSQAQQYYGLADKMRPKFGTEPRVMMGPDGKLVNVVVGEDGSTQVLPFGVKPSMKMQDLGGRVVAVDENTLGNGQAFNKTQTPDSLASVGATLRGQNLTDARAREQIQLGKVPAGYRQNLDGTLSFIPGGPADPNAAKRAAPTEFQGKSATFGARALEADRILNGLGTDYSPAAVNTKAALGRVPIVGGGLEYGANLALSDNSQKAEQAQRDFVNAVLRQESGAAISSSEFDNARKQYFPQPGDSQAVIVQKARNRQLAINGFRENARPGAVDELVGIGAAPTTASAQAGPRAINPNDPLGLRR